VKLRLFSSRKGVSEPNLVAIQDRELEMLPTLLACPLRPDEPYTPVRAEVTINGRQFMVLCDLVRPVHRRALVAAGELGENDSHRVMGAFRLLLAR
jgi:hypothetical protein